MQQAVRDALIAFMAATAQSQAELTKEAQKAGIAHAQVNDDGQNTGGENRRSMSSSSISYRSY